jgi:hypothetical protein
MRRTNFPQNLKIIQGFLLKFMQIMSTNIYLEDVRRKPRINYCSLKYLIYKNIVYRKLILIIIILFVKNLNFNKILYIECLFILSMHLSFSWVLTVNILFIFPEDSYLLSVLSLYLLNQKRERERERNLTQSRNDRNKSRNNSIL